MTDLELQIAESFSRLYPVPDPTANWEGVLGGARGRRRRTGLFTPMTTRRRLVLALALALAIAAALAVSTLFSSSPRVLERAQAALDPRGRILHVVSRWVDDRITVDESWTLPDGSLDHVVSRYPGESFGSDCVISESESRCWNPALNVVDVWRHRLPEPGLAPQPAFRYGADWPQGVDQALSAGYARLIGSTSFCGKDVYEVLLAVPGPAGPPQFRQGESHTVYLDRETYLPVAEKMPESMTTRYFDTFEFLPDTAENRQALALPAPADAEVVVHPVGVYPLEQKGPPPAGSAGTAGWGCSPQR